MYAIEMFEVGTPRVKVHPEPQPESFTKDQLTERLRDLDTILRNSDGSEQVKYDEAQSEKSLLSILMEAKLYPQLELDYLIKHKQLQIKQNKEGSFKKSLLEKQLADLMKQTEVLGISLTDKFKNKRDFFMPPAGAAAVADGYSSEGEVFGSSGSSDSSRSSSDGSQKNLFGRDDDRFGGKKSMNLKKSKSKSKSRKSRRKSRKSRIKSRKSRRKSRKLKYKYFLI